MELKALTGRIIGCAIGIRRALGPGHRESAYAAAMDIALREDGLSATWEPAYPIRYKERVIGTCRPDFVVENAVVLELKRADWLDSEARAQTLGYLRVTGKRAGLLISFRAHPLSAASNVSSSDVLFLSSGPPCPTTWHIRRFP